MSKSHRTGALLRRTQQPHSPAGALVTRWKRLHDGDREPYRMKSAVAGLVAEAMRFIRVLGRRSWRAGAWSRQVFRRRGAISTQASSSAQSRSGRKLGALGATAANKAAAIYSQNQGRGEARGLKLLEAAVERGEPAATELLPEYANAHYMLALALGRYSQRISDRSGPRGGAGNTCCTALDKTLELEPHHADAHIALGLFNAEIVSLNWAR